MTKLRFGRSSVEVRQIFRRGSGEVWERFKRGSEEVQEGLGELQGRIGLEKLEEKDQFLKLLMKKEEESRN